MSKKTLIVNLAASHVSISAFHAEGSKLVLDQFFTEDLSPGLADDDWINNATGVVARLASSKGIKGDATIIVPSFLLLQKALKVAQVEAARQAQIIAFEAQNNIPYPLNEVVWDSQIISSDGVEAEVLLFALRTEMAARIANAIAATGIRPKKIQAAPILDVQAQRFVGGAVEGEEVLFINVGARTTGLGFISANHTNVQAANIGGNLLTQGISDNTGQQFNNSESLKVGYFTHVIQLPETDPQLAILQANTQSFTRRLSQDINRRLIGIKRSGRRPSKIIVTGRSSQVPGLSQQLAESLALPVEEFNPLSAISLSTGMNADYILQHIHQLSEVVGEASRLVLPEALGVNLIPRDIATQINFDARKIMIATAVTLLALSPWPIWSALDEAGDYNVEQEKKISKKLDELKGFKTKITAKHTESEVILGVNKQLEYVVSNSANWPVFLADLQARIGLAKNTWIEDLQIRREQTAVVPGAEADPSKPTPPAFVIKVVIKVRTLLEKVPPGKSFNAPEFKERRTVLLDSLKKSPFVTDIPQDEIKVEFSKETNIPLTTLTLVIKPDKAL